MEKLSIPKSKFTKIYILRNLPHFLPRTIWNPCLFMPTLNIIILRKKIIKEKLEGSHQYQIIRFAFIVKYADFHKDSLRIPYQRRRFPQRFLLATNTRSRNSPSANKSQSSKQDGKTEEGSAEQVSWETHEPIGKCGSKKVRSHCCLGSGW